MMIELVVNNGSSSSSSNPVNCGTCKYWGEKYREYREYREEEIFRKCTRIEHDKDNKSSLDEFDYDFDEDGSKQRTIDEVKEYRKTHVACVKDGSGYYAAIKCAADFGCILWEKKDG
jgi:hypothetical protein